MQPIIYAEARSTLNSVQFTQEQRDHGGKRLSDELLRKERIEPSKVFSYTPSAELLTFFNGGWLHLEKPGIFLFQFSVAPTYVPSELRRALNKMSKRGARGQIF